MSNKLCCIFFLLANFLFIIGPAHAFIAYDEETNDAVELIDFEYDRLRFIEGQVIEYYDFDDFERKLATIEEIEDNFSSVTLKITDNQTKKTRNLIVKIEN